MDRRLFSLIVAALLLPVFARLIWFFPGFALPRSIATPDYASLKMPEAPVSTPAAADVKQSAGTVLIDDAHANQFLLSEVESLTGALTQRGGRFVLNSETEELNAQLKSADSYVVISPSHEFTPAEVAS